MRKRTHHKQRRELQSTIMLNILNADILALILNHMDTRSIARLASAITATRAACVEVLRSRERNARRVFHAKPTRFKTWIAYLAYIEKRYEQIQTSPLAAGLMRSCFVSETGQVMTFGMDDPPGSPKTERRPTGLLGLGTIRTNSRCTVVQIPKPIFTLDSKRIHSVSAASSYTAAVSHTGSVYTWGNGGDGRLGHGNTSHEHTPKHVSSLIGTFIIAVATGNAHCIATTIEGAVFAWGRSHYGQCGLGAFRTTHSTPTEMNAMPRGCKIAHAAAGRDHSLVVTNTGSVYAFGRGHTGQLGCGPDVKKLHTPNRVKRLHQQYAKRVATGSYHSIALCEPGKVYTWGSNSFGELGLGWCNAGIMSIPTQVYSLRAVTVRDINASDALSCAISTNGELFMWGDTALTGRTGEANTTAPIRVHTLAGENIAGIAIGDAHAIATAKNGHIFIWGLQLPCGHGPQRLTGYRTAHQPHTLSNIPTSQ